MTLGELRAALSGLCAPDLTVSPAGRLVVDVVLGERHQKVQISTDGDWFQLDSRVCNAGGGGLGIPVVDLTKMILAFNRDQEVIGLARDEDHWLVGRADVQATASLSEMVVVLRALASECDRMELRLTGDDR